MNLLGGYVARTLTSSILLVLFLVVGLDIVSAIIDQLKDLRGDYTFAQALTYVMLTIPGRIYEYIPLSVLIGCLVGLGILSSSSEITVMRATGVSLVRFFMWVVRPVLIVAVLSLLISEYIAPVTDRWAATHKDLKLLGKSVTQVSARGLWHREDNTYMHFNVVQPGGVLLGVNFFFFNDEGELVLARSARRASYMGDRWLLESVDETAISHDEVRSARHSTMNWNTSLTAESLALLASEPESLSISDLWRYIAYLDNNTLDSDPYQLALWKKLTQPLAIISLLLIAVSFVFGPLRSATMGYKVFVGVVVGICFQFAQNLLGPASLIYGFAPVIATLLPIAICALIGFIMLKRTT